MLPYLISHITMSLPSDAVDPLPDRARSSLYPMLTVPSADETTDRNPFFDADLRGHRIQSKRPDSNAKRKGNHVIQV
jgi:hypothetical protein